MRVLAFAVILLLVAGTVGCRITGPEPGDAELDTIEKQIADLIGAAPAKQVSACKTLAFGSKPCGGPWRFLVYSSEYTEEARLIQLVATYNELQERLNRERGLMSDCSIAVEPAVELRNGFCIASQDAAF
jgi:hypothetical protein